MSKPIKYIPCFQLNEWPACSSAICGGLGCFDCGMDIGGASGAGGELFVKDYHYEVYAPAVSPRATPEELSAASLLVEQLNKLSGD
jgi:hypothetical protein